MHPIQHLFTSAALLAALGSSAASNDTCYNIDGSVSSVSYRCNNETTRHTTCCQPGAVCYSNGVCQTINQGVEDDQRVGCTDRTWQDAACLKECAQYAPDSSAGIRPCDGITEGNHYCCDTGADGIGSYACCQNASDIFILGKSIPTVLAQMPLSQTSTPSTATSTGTGTGTATATSTLTNGGNKNGGGGSSSNNKTKTETSGLGVGLGVGIPVAAAIVGGICFFVWRSRRKERQQQQQQKEGAAPFSHDGTNSPYGGGNGYPGGMTAAQGYSPISQGGHMQQQHFGHQPGQTPADGLPKYAGYGAGSPQEMPARSTPAEMP